MLHNKREMPPGHLPPLLAIIFLFLLVNFGFHRFQSRSSKNRKHSHAFPRSNPELCFAVNEGPRKMGKALTENVRQSAVQSSGPASQKS